MYKNYNEILIIYKKFRIYRIFPSFRHKRSKFEQKQLKYYSLTTKKKNIYEKKT